MADNHPPRQVRSLDDLVSCPICLDSLIDPRTLSCLHSFCAVCLEGCRRALRRDIECPVCKRVTTLSVHGVGGLPIDYRVQQIRDVIASQLEATNRRETEADRLRVEPAVQSNAASAAVNEGVVQRCDMCKAHQSAGAADRTACASAAEAVAHCLQCVMWFCNTCVVKHGASALFASHDVVHMAAQASSLGLGSMFCLVHHLQVVRYFCRSCQHLLCTVCAVDHDSSHNAEPLDRSILDRCYNDIFKGSVTVRGILSHVTSRIKCLETLRQRHQEALYVVQRLISERAEGIVARVREQESSLLRDAQRRFDAKLVEHGANHVGDLGIVRGQLNELVAYLTQVVDKNASHRCLIEYEDLMARIKSAIDLPLPPVGGRDIRCRKVVQFVPSSSDMDLVIGSLRDCNVDEENDTMQQTTSGAEFGGDTSPSSSSSSVLSGGPLRKRTASILNALSPSRRDTKLGRLKDVSRASVSSFDRRLSAGAASTSGGNTSSSLSDGAADGACTFTMSASFGASTSGASSSGGSHGLSSAITSTRKRPHSSFNEKFKLALARSFNTVSSSAGSLHDLSAVDSGNQSIDANVTTANGTSGDSAMNSGSLDVPSTRYDPFLPTTPTSPGISVAVESPVSVRSASVSSPISFSQLRLLSSAIDASETRPSSSSDSDMVSSSPPAAFASLVAELGDRSRFRSSIHFTRSRLTAILGYSPTNSELDLFNRDSPRSSVPSYSSLNLSTSASSSDTALVMDSPLAGASSVVRAGASSVVRASTLVSCTARLLCSVGESGLMPGKLSDCSSVAFLSTGDVVVAEISRLQVFNRAGKSMHVIGWCKLRPQCVTVLPNGNIACTDKKDRVVKVYESVLSSEPISTWGQGTMGCPAGVDFMSNGNLVVTDTERKCVLVYGSQSQVVLRIGAQSTDAVQQFQNPAYVAVERASNHIYVSDPGFGCIEVFDRMGKLVRRIFPDYSDGTFVRLGGLCFDGSGNLIVCDVENHRVTLMSPEGQLIQHLLTQADGLIYPCDVAFDSATSTLAVIESHAMLFRGEPHQALKLFSFS